MPGKLRIFGIRLRDRNPMITAIATNCLRHDSDSGSIILDAYFFPMTDAIFDALAGSDVLIDFGRFLKVEVSEAR